MLGVFFSRFRSETLFFFFFFSVRIYLNKRSSRRGSSNGTRGVGIEVHILIRDFQSRRWAFALAKSARQFSHSFFPSSVLPVLFDTSPSLKEIAYRKVGGLTSPSRLRGCGVESRSPSLCQEKQSCDVV